MGLNFTSNETNGDSIIAFPASFVTILADFPGLLALSRDTNKCYQIRFQPRCAHKAYPWASCSKLNLSAPLSSLPPPPGISRLQSKWGKTEQYYIELFSPRRSSLFFALQRHCCANDKHLLFSSIGKKSENCAKPQPLLDLCDSKSTSGGHIFSIGTTSIPNNDSRILVF